MKLSTCRWRPGSNTEPAVYAARGKTTNALYRNSTQAAELCKLVKIAGAATWVANNCDMLAGTAKARDNA